MRIADTTSNAVAQRRSVKRSSQIQNLAASPWPDGVCSACRLRAAAFGLTPQDVEDALRRQNAALQRQLEALAEIERELTSPGLPVRPRTGLPE